jgi:hypothetical protein
MTKAEKSPSLERSVFAEWERREGEPNKWLDRFQTYLLLGPSRSLYAAYTAWRERSGAKSAQKRAGLPQSRFGLPQSWRLAAEKWQWQQRAEAFDEHERAQHVAEWTRRRDELREHEWKFSQELLDKARQMLVFPLAKTVRSTQDGGQTVVTEVYPAQWKLSDAARMLEAASKLARLAVGEETERIGIHNDVQITADDLVQAAREVMEWERQTYDLSTDKTE